MSERVSFGRYQWQLFCLALSFFSRLPIPANTPYSNERMNRAGRYFALVGVLLGALCGGFFTVVSELLPASIAIVLTMVFSLLLTGAFHEDGLADMADGIGGGMTHERRLEIMKDSRLGTYGVSTLVMALFLKYATLVELSTQANLFAVFVIGYAFSRAVAASLISAMPYVSDPKGSKSKPLANTQTPGELVFLALCGVLPALMYDMTLAAILIAFALVFRLVFTKWLLARLGGFTGDCLGAAQQLVELMTYVLMLMVLMV